MSAAAAGAASTAPAAPAPAAAVAAPPPPPAPVMREEKAVITPAAPAGFMATPPALDPAIAQVYLPIIVDERDAVRTVTNDAGGQISVKRIQLLYEAGLLGIAAVRFADPKRRIDTQTDYMLLARPDAGPTGIDWAKAESIPVDSRKILREAEIAGGGEGPFFAPVPADVSAVKKLAGTAKDFADWLYYNATFKINVHPDLGLAQNPGEDERAFHIRLQQAARERRDAEVDKLSKQYARQLGTLSDKLVRAQQNLNEAQAKVQAKQTEQWVNIGESVVGFFMGKRSSRAVSSATSKWNQANQASGNVEEAQQAIAKLQTEQKGLQNELQTQVDEITGRWAQVMETLQSEELKPRRTDVDVKATPVGWAPSWQIVFDEAGREQSATVPAYQLPAVG